MSTPKTTGDAATAAITEMNGALTGDDQAPVQPQAPVQRAPDPVQPPTAQPQAPVQPATEAPPVSDDLVTGALAALGARQEAAPTPPADDSAVDPAEEEAILNASKTNAKLGHTFAKLRTDVKDYKQKVAALQTELAEKKDGGEAQALLQQQIDEKNKALVDMEDRLGKVSLESSPAFQAKYDGRVGQVGQKLGQSLVQFANVEADKAPGVVREFLRSTPQQLDKKLEGLSPSIAGLVMNAWQEAHGIVAERDAAIKEWRKTSAATEMESHNSQTQENIKARQDAALAALDDAAGNGCFVYKDIGTPESKKSSENYRNAFQGFVQTAEHKELVRKAADGFAAPALYKVIDMQSSRIKELMGMLRGESTESQMPISGHFEEAAPPPRRVEAPTGTARELRDNAAARAAQALKGF